MIKIDPTAGGWISYTDWVLDSHPISHHPIVFRKDFALSRRPLTAELLITAADHYALWLNGQLIGHGPARSYPRHKLYDTYDIARYLRKGRNQFAAQIVPCTGANSVGTYTRMGLFLQAQIRVAKRRRMVIASDKSWSTRIADWIRVNDNLVSHPVGTQEHANKDAEPANWRTAPLDSNWTPALYLGPAGLAPWLELLPRPIPHLVESASTPRLVWQGSARRALHDPAENLAIRFNREPLRAQKVMSPNATGTFADGETNVWTFDFGRTRFIRPSLHITDVRGPVRFELYYDMAMEGRPSAYRGFASPAEGFCDTCSIDGKVGRAISWEALAPRGFRFLTVKLAGAGHARFRLQCHNVDYPYAGNTRFSSSDAFMQDVWEISKENLRSSTTDVVVDCCSRENLLWTMDAAVALKAAFYSFGETAMWQRCNNLIIDGIDPDGRPSAVVPADIPSSLYDQTMHWVLSLEEYHMATGDGSLLIEAADPLARLLRRCEQNMTADDLFVPPAESWHWLDWAAIDKRPYSLPVNALLALTAKAAMRIAEVVGHELLRTIAVNIHRRLVRSIPEFFDASRQAFRSQQSPRRPLHLPLERNNNRTTDIARRNTHSLHANLYSAMTGFGGAAMCQAALKHSAERLAEPASLMNRIGLSHVDVLLSPLVTAEHGPAVLHALHALYHPFIDAGAPTWASQAASGKASPFNTAHGWGASVNSLIVERLIGLRPAAPGWRGITFAPPKGPLLDDYDYCLHSPVGVVQVSRQDDRFIARWPKGIPLDFHSVRYLGTGRNLELK